jgi:hypothetical protein
VLSNVTDCFRGTNAGRTAGVAGGSETSETSEVEGGAGGDDIFDTEDDGLSLAGVLRLPSSGMLVN